MKRDAENLTPLHRAAEQTAHPQVVEALVAAGADPNAENDWGWTPLHRAARWSEHPEVVQALVAAGADALMRNQSNLTPGQLAAEQSEHPEVVGALESADGASLQVSIPAPDSKAGLTQPVDDRSGGQTLVQAVDCERWGTSKYFARATVADVRACLEVGADPTKRDAENLSPLHRAAGSAADPMVIEALVAAGADPDAKNGWGWTPLHRAATRSGHPEIVGALVAVGADPHARNESGRTPLQEALRRSKHPKVVTALEAAAGASRKAQAVSVPAPATKPGLPAPLSDQASSRNARRAANCEQWGSMDYFASATIADVRACLEAGADPHAKNELGESPLQNAFRGNDNPEVVQVLEVATGMSRQAAVCEGWNTPQYFLRATAADLAACLEQGADPEVRGEDRYRPLHSAAAYTDDPEVIQVLVNAGAKPQQMLGSRAFGANMIEVSNEALTPLHSAAAKNDNPAITKALIKAGANPNRKGGIGASPLHQAAEWGSAEVVRALIDAGADIERSGPKHWMDSKKPLHLAAERNIPEVVQTLIDAGANLEAQDKNGFTPLHYATEDNPNPAVRETLLAAGAGKTERARAGSSARRKSQQGDGRGLGALIAGVTAATVATASGLDTAEALAVGGSVAESVLTGQAPSAGTGGGSAPGGSGPAESPRGGGSCLIPGYPSPPAGVAGVGLPWCPASVGMQVRAFALQAAGIQCAVAEASPAPPETVSQARSQIRDVCARLAAVSAKFGSNNCRCPSDFGP